MSELLVLVLNTPDGRDHAVEGVAMARKPEVFVREITDEEGQRLVWSKAALTYIVPFAWRTGGAPRLSSHTHRHYDGPTRRHPFSSSGQGRQPHDA